MKMRDYRSADKKDLMATLSFLYYHVTLVPIQNALFIFCSFNDTQ